MGFEPTTQLDTTHPRQSALLLSSSAGWDQISHLIYSTSDEQANYQLSMKEKAGAQVRLKEKGESPQALLSLTLAQLE